MKNKKYVLDLLKSENEQLRKMHEIIEKALAEETLITTTIQDTEEERSYGEKLSDKVAQFGGSWKFIIIFGVILMLWILYNTQVMHNKSFDPYPYIKFNSVVYCRNPGTDYYDESEQKESERPKKIYQRLYDQPKI